MATKLDTVDPAVVRLPVERQHFNLLLASNPNYFSNLIDSPFKGVVKQIGNTTYEELGCVGLNPQLDLLEAVVQIKQNNGYSGGICAAGSLEYVRFYADYSNSGTWTDLGFSSVRVHDIPGALPISYGVKINIDPVRHLCSQNNTIKIRAILSWNALPPANTPNYPPVWGNVSDVNVQIQPAFRRRFADVVSELSLAKLSKDLVETLQSFDQSAELKITPQPLSLVEREENYRALQVPVHRFAFDELHKAANSPSELQSMLVASTPLAKYLSSKKDLDDLIANFLKPPSNTTYEEVRCAGLRPEDDAVSAVVTIKQPGGYSGDLCHTGSAEYVAFWLKLDGSATWEHLGTSAVQVHDLGTIPAGGVQYAVYLPADLSAHRQLCADGPLMGTLRAVLQWSVPPPSATVPPYWGNIADARVQLRPGDPAQQQLPALLNISGYSVDDIHGNGMLNGNAPFGGVVAIRGIMGGFPASMRQYKIEVRKQGTLSWSTLDNPIDVQFYRFDAANGIVDCSPSLGFQFQCTKTITPVAGWYDYINATNGATHDVLVDNTLGFWHTNITDEATWEVKVTFRDPITLSLTPTQTVTLRIDNTAPTMHAQFNAGGQCGKFAVGAQISGTYNAHDPGSNPLVLNPADPIFQHFASISAIVLPPGLIPHNVNLDASGSNTEVLPATGQDGAWTLDTTNGQPCGYVIRFLGSDRTIYGTVSGAIFNLVTLTGEYDLGFCLG
jgi:hypothetical protein